MQPPRDVKHGLGEMAPESGEWCHSSGIGPAPLNREMGRSVVMVLHDLNLAARYAAYLVVMKDGQAVT